MAGQQQVTRHTNNFLAIIYLMMGMALLSTMDAVAKLMTEVDYSVEQVLAVRSWMIIPVMVAWVYFRQGSVTSLKTKRVKLHVIRGVIGFCAPFFFFRALAEMPLADVTVLFFASPFIMTALSIPLFGEKVGIHRWGAIIVGFIGVLIILQPGGSTFQLAAVFALVGCFAYSVIGLMVRWMSDTENSFTIVFYFNVAIGVICGVMTPFSWTPILVEHYWMYGAMASLALIGHVCLTKAFSMGEMATVTPFEYTSLVWAVLLGFFLWGDIPQANVWLGAAIVIACGLYILYRERQRQATVTPPVTDMP